MLVQCLWAALPPPTSLHTVTPLPVLALGEGVPLHLVCNILSSRFGAHTSFCVHAHAAPCEEIDSPRQKLIYKAIAN